MTEDILENIPEGTVYTTRTIIISTFFGGLLAGGYMVYHNFKTFGEHKKAVVAIVLTIITLLAFIATGFFPALDRIPPIFYTIFITLAVSLLTKRYQGSLVAKHISNNGKIYSTGRAVAVCVISIIVIAAFLLGAYLLQDAAAGNL